VSSTNCEGFAVSSYFLTLRVEFLPQHLSFKCTEPVLFT